MSISLNKLSSETSPYLLRHSTNAIYWYPWGNEAFRKAKRENKLILISVGYSSCHWCHVMEREAFSNIEVAEFMNNNFVCIKVDREERPDVDQIYMNAVQIITRSGGWPLNCFALPNGKPIYGGTYFKAEAWLDIVKSLYNTWVTEPQRVIEVADELTEGIAESGVIKRKHEENSEEPELLNKYISNWSKHFDSRNGCNRGAPKFPLPGSLQFLLSYSDTINHTELKGHVKLSLEKISRGGIYDHLGGGFFRYSVDEQWQVPHFEKMLYDNAQLVSLYSQAYKVFGTSEFKITVYETIEFIKRELHNNGGGFVSAIDADSEGAEGKYYTFTKSEVEDLVGMHSELASIILGITASGNFEGKNVPRIATSINEAACLLGLDTKTVENRFYESKRLLLQARNRRVRPFTDNKIILSWNALTVSALANAHIVFNNNDFLEDAIACAMFIESNFTRSKGELYHVMCRGVKSIPAFSDDYALLAKAYIDLYLATLDNAWIDKSKQLIDKAIEQFFDKELNMFYYTTTHDENIIVRKMEITDGVIPSSNAIMAECLLWLGLYFDDNYYIDLKNQMLSNLKEHIEVGGPYVYKWAHVHLLSIVKPVQLRVSGPNAAQNIKTILKMTDYPLIVPRIIGNDEITNYQTKPANLYQLCIGNRCTQALSNVDEVITLLKGESPIGGFQ